MRWAIDVSIIVAAVALLWIAAKITCDCRRRSKDRAARWERARQRWHQGGSVSWRDDRGAVAVELAILLPILIVLTFAGIDLGLAGADAAAAQHAANVIGGDGCEDLTAADAMLSGSGWEVTEAEGLVTVTRTRPSFLFVGPSERTVTRTAVCTQEVAP